jgi:hypothetical protein
MTLMPACRSRLRVWTFVLVSTLGLLLLLPTARFRAVRCTAYFGSMTFALRAADARSTPCQS